MRKTLILTLSLLMLFVTACKKTKTEKEAESASNCLLTESVFSTSNETGKFLYSYDNNGKVSKIKVDGENLEINYVYSSNQIIETAKEGTDITTFTYKLDASGKIISSARRNSNYTDENNDYEYLYNSDGYLTETKRTRLDNNSKTSEKYTYTNGNLTTVNDGSFNKIIAYNNDLSNERLFVFNLDSDFPSFYSHALKGYFGKQSKNLPSRLSYSGYTEDYVYEKDGKNNITKVSMSSNNGNGIIYTNKYTCK